MTHSWKEKLDDAGVKFVEAHAKARQVRPPASLDFGEIGRWLKEQRTVWSAYPELDEKRKAQLTPEFVRLYVHTHPEVELNAEEMQVLFDREEFPVPRAEELEWTQRIALALEADPNMRMQAYEAVGSAIVWLQRMFAGGLKKQLGTAIPNSSSEFFAALAPQLEWAANMLRGNITKSPGRFNVELAGLADSILEHQKEPLTQVELYDALAAAGAELPEDPEAFRLWLHRARKQGLVTKFRIRRSKLHSTEPIGD